MEKDTCTKILFATITMAIIIVSVFCFVKPTLADETYDFKVPDPPEGVHVTKSTTILGTINPIVTWVSGVVGIVCVAYIVFAGIKITTSGENEENRKKAIKMITYAIIGLVTVLVAYAIVAIVASGLEKI